MERLRRVVKWYVAWTMAWVATLCGLANAAPAEYRTGAAPAWIVPIAHAGAVERAGGEAGGLRALLSDTQVRIDGQGTTTYRHYASQASDSDGVEQGGNISIDFDPSYQVLTLHRINIIRGPMVMDKLGSATVHVLQREKQLEYRIYDGRRTASIVLDDLRVGDIVEYAYSVSGSNPVFKNMAEGTADLQWRVPVERVFVRVMMPGARKLTIVPLNTDAAPVVSDADGYRDYRWDLHKVAGLKVERDAPDGYDPYAYVQWSEFPSWQAVVHWATPLYAVAGGAGAALDKEIARIGQSSASPQERTAAVLRMVQRDIRYLGIEVGQGSHAPNPPATVFQRRFGDCKDKTRLTVTMLQALGIDARPALVHTKQGAALAQWVPSPNNFNHVIVVVQLAGKRYWLDPTLSVQAGDLDHIYQPDYGLALVLDGTTRTLVKMAPPANSHKSVHAIVDVTAGLDHPVRYSVKTTSSGRDADALRATVAIQGASDLALNYLKFYARKYPGIRVAQPLAIADDAVKNTITVTETYTIPDFWRTSKKKKRREASIQSADLDSRLQQPDDLMRRAPLRLKYPDVIDEVTEVRLPSAWDLAAQESAVRHSAFEFSHKIEPSTDRRTLRLTSHFHTLAGEVPADELAAYAASLKEADGVVGYRLYASLGPGAVQSAKDISGWIILAAWVLVILVLRQILSRYSPPEHVWLNRHLLYCVTTGLGLLLIVLILGKSAKDQLPLSLTIIVFTMYRLRALTILAPPAHWLGGAAQPAGDSAPGNYRWVFGTVVLTMEISAGALAALTAMSAVDMLF